MVHFEITTRIGCKNMCSYCPQNTLLKAYFEKDRVVMLSLDTYKLCLSKIPKSVDIHFSGYAEPFLNPQCSEMILHTYKEGYNISMFTTVVGITEKYVELIKEIPFETFTVHLPDNMDLTEIKVDEQYIKIVDLLIQNDIKNLSFMCPVRSLDEKINPALREVFDKHDFKVNKRVVHSRSGSVDLEGVEKQKKLVGEIPYCDRLKCNVLLPNGDVALCCMDYGLKHKLGNLLRDDFDDLYNNETFKMLMKGLTDDSIDSLCRTCEHAADLQKKSVKLFLSKTVKALKERDVSKIKKFVKRKYKALKNLNKS